MKFEAQITTESSLLVDYVTKSPWMWNQIIKICAEKCFRLNVMWSEVSESIFSANAKVDENFFLEEIFQDRFEKLCEKRRKRIRSTM